MRELTYAQRLTWYEQQGVHQLRKLWEAAPKKQENGEGRPNWDLLAHIGTKLVSSSRSGLVQESQQQLAHSLIVHRKKVTRCMQFLRLSGFLELETAAHGGPNPRPAVYRLSWLMEQCQNSSETVPSQEGSLSNGTVPSQEGSLYQETVPSRSETVPSRGGDSALSGGHLLGTTSDFSSVVEKSSHALRAPNVNSADEERRRIERAKTRALEEMQLDKQLKQEARGVAEAAALRLATARENKQRDIPQTYARGIVRKDEGAVTDKLVRTIAHNWPLTLQSKSKQDRTLLEDYCAIQYTDKHSNSGVVRNHLNSREIQLQEEAAQLLKSVRVGAQEDYTNNGTKLEHYGTGDGAGATF